jgi:sporulation protein YlmC with PRC-barrel domain
MKKHASTLTAAALTLAGALWATGPAWAEVAGATTTVQATVSESIQLAEGWSVKKTLLGKTIYNDTGLKLGKVEDLIISPDKSVSYIIVGAGGFVGIDRHDVAVPVTQIQDHAGKLVMAGATQDTIRAMPEFTYMKDSANRDRFVAAADKDIAKGKAKVADLEKKAGVANADAKSRIDGQIATLRADLSSAQAKLNEMKQATAMRWKEFEAGVSASTARLRKSIDTAKG